MLRAHLNGQDLLRTVVRSEPAVMFELQSAGQRLMTEAGSASLVAWKARTRAALHPVMRPFLDLFRIPRWSPDFVTMVTDGGTWPVYGRDLDTELDRIAATPATVLEAELGPHVAAGRLPDRVAALAAGEPAAVAELRTAAVAFHAVAVAPYWGEIVAAVHADRAARGSAIVGQGIERVLANLSPELTWDSSTLSYQCPGGEDLTVAGGGRGVILVPSYLKAQPCFGMVGDQPLVIGYPIERNRQELTSGKPLADLLGRTRAAVLGAVNGGRNTTQLARAAGTSIPSASQHATVLRQAGLISTHRTGEAVEHSLTPLGESLLQASGTAPNATR